MRYNHDSWSIELPKNWQVEESEDVISFYHPDGVGSFDVSQFFKDEGEITIADVIEFAEVASHEEIELPYLSGIHYKEVEENETIFQWCLAAGSQLIYVTYVCETGDEEIEEEERKSLIESLRAL